jgi:hypothetical protein
MSSVTATAAERRQAAAPPSRKRPGAALRQRAYRARKRSGLITLSIEVDHFEIAELLVGEGLLGAWDSEDRAAVRSAFEAALARGSLRITRFTD